MTLKPCAVRIKVGTEKAAELFTRWEGFARMHCDMKCPLTFVGSFVHKYDGKEPFFSIVFATDAEDPTSELEIVVGALRAELIALQHKLGQETPKGWFISETEIFTEETWGDATITEQALFINALDGEVWVFGRRGEFFEPTVALDEGVTEVASYYSPIAREGALFAMGIQTLDIPEKSRLEDYTGIKWGIDFLEAGDDEDEVAGDDWLTYVYFRGRVEQFDGTSWKVVSLYEDVPSDVRTILLTGLHAPRVLDH